MRAAVHIGRVQVGLGAASGDRGKRAAAQGGRQRATKAPERGGGESPGAPGSHRDMSQRSRGP